MPDNDNDREFSYGSARSIDWGPLPQDQPQPAPEQKPEDQK